MSIKKTLGLLFLLVVFVYLLIGLSNVYTRGYWFGTYSQIENHLENWNKDFDSNYDAITNDTIKTVYEIYDAFFSPRELNLIGNSEWGDSLYLNSSYLIIDNVIDYCVLPRAHVFDTARIACEDDKTYFLDELYKLDSIKYFDILSFFQSEFATKHLKTISDFRPMTKYDSETILYSDKHRIKELYNFLDRSNLIGYSWITRGKIEFLEPLIKVDVGHWDGWHIISHPSIFRMVINSEMNEAEISFRLMYEFGGARLEKINNQWKLVNSEMGGIE